MKNNEVLHIDIPQFQNDLISWYQDNKRDLPWRKDQDPYKVWVSEIMLQQTKVDTVIPYFNQFIKKFPSVQDLAKAEEQDVLKSWEGLGYYSRARNLQNAIREVMASYEGTIPANSADLGALKGVGPYTKGAILSIAYNQPEPAVDGNVMRVLSRILKIDEDIAKPRTKKLFEEIVRELISRADPSSFNQGMMELGAIVCTPKNPMCMLCPVQRHCHAFAEGIENELPVKSKGKKQKTVPYVALLIQNKQGKYLIEKRPDTGLLANLWQFPMISIAETGFNQIPDWFEKEYGINVRLKREAGRLKHVFSHLIWELEVHQAVSSDTKTNRKDAQFVSQNEMKAFPFPVSHQKMMQFL
ncbi:A/G-specific adenine glycosylase [Virgibacillus phasianinus]|uniref:Adenine DNA glycosylase n=1 Tax=Virgibacillus phasianinus TaxID=2017483 RepID=A0A220TZI9_9BACI|nr:A/G-specific adenine glycosylase [Virgibacillus phasianinus]ASK61053.1 A/G-specific adenine glycosylase [Virgibacillus phasianinus]